MNEETWRTVKRLLSPVINSSSGYLDELLEYNFSDLKDLPKYNGSRAERLYRPCFEMKKVEADYLDFLDEQISLNARGDEWTKVLKERRDALRPYIGKELMIVTFYSQEGSITSRIDMATEQLIYIEGEALNL